GNVTDPFYVGTVSFTSTDPSFAGAPISYTFTAGDAGVHTFSGLSLSSVGTQSITATDAGNSVTGSQTGIVVTTGTTHLVVNGFTNPTISGATHNLPLIAETASNSVDPFHGRPVKFP